MNFESRVTGFFCAIKSTAL